jgi:hypothetical protein
MAPIIVGMANLREDKSFIEAALEGFKQQRQLIDQKMAELRRRSVTRK